MLTPTPIDRRVAPLPPEGLIVLSLVIRMLTALARSPSVAGMDPCPPLPSLVPRPTGRLTRPPSSSSPPSLLPPFRSNHLLGPSWSHPTPTCVPPPPVFSASINTADSTRTVQARPHVALVPRVRRACPTTHFSLRAPDQAQEVCVRHRTRQARPLGAEEVVCGRQV